MESTLFLRKKKPLQVPDPGQRVRLRTARGRWRGSFRAVSHPYTDDLVGAVVIVVAEEWEYWDAIREGRHAVGLAWPVRQIEVVWPLGEKKPRELPQGLQEKRARGEPRPSTGARQKLVKRRSWWRMLVR